MRPRTVSVCTAVEARRREKADAASPTSAAAAAVTRGRRRSQSWGSCADGGAAVSSVRLTAMLAVLATLANGVAGFAPAATTSAAVVDPHQRHHHHHHFTTKVGQLQATAATAAAAPPSVTATTLTQASLRGGSNAGSGKGDGKRPRSSSVSFALGSTATAAAAASVSAAESPSTTSSSSSPSPRGFGKFAKVGRRRPKPHKAAQLALARGSLPSLGESVSRLRKGVHYLEEEEMQLLEHALFIAAFVHTQRLGGRGGRARMQRNVEVCIILGQLEVGLDALLAAVLSGAVDDESTTAAAAAAADTSKSQHSIESAAAVAAATVAERAPISGSSHVFEKKNSINAYYSPASPQVSLEEEELKARFGKRVARLAQGHAHLESVSQAARASMAERRGSISPEEEKQQRDMFRNLVMLEAADWQVLTLHLAGHLQKLRALGSFEPAERDAVAKEALDVYGPLAHRLGIHQLRSELETLAFAHLYPEEYEGVVDDITSWHGRLDSMLHRTRDEITEALQSAPGFLSKVESVILTGRTKEAYSMWRKMMRQGVGAEAIFDMVALRIVIQPKRIIGESPEDFRKREQNLCYEAMEVISRTYPLMPGRDKDYIASPKANGYRSLHTTAMLPTAGPNSDLRPFEIQVRSAVMHHQAEFGVAAHWGYKSPDGAKSETEAISRSRVRAQPAAHGIKNGKGLVNWLQTELRKNRVYVIVNGLIWDLEKSATAQDVMKQLSLLNIYPDRLGTQIANYCAAVNGEPVALDYQLKNGDLISVQIA